MDRSSASRPGRPDTPGGLEHGREGRERIEERLARRGGGVELLRLPAAVFALATRSRGWLYDHGLMPIERLEVPVISVGNLTAGGTGKTPMVAHLARELARRGRRPGILSRGYGAQVDGANDEAALLAELLPGVPHVQDPDRARGGRELERTGVEAIVLDDGFQHRRLARDLDLVLIDATRPWGLAASGTGEPVRALLPRGLLRESPRALARADALVLTRVDQVGAAQLAELSAELERLTPGKPRIESVHLAIALVAPDGERRPPSELADAEVELASGIGHPAAFEHSVAALGARVRAHHRFPDHHAWSAAEAARLRRGEGELRVITTAKDAVKLRALGLAPWVLAVELELVAGAQVLAALLDALPESRAGVGRQALHGGLGG